MLSVVNEDGTTSTSSLIDEIVREGARRMLAAALEVKLPLLPGHPPPPARVRTVCSVWCFGSAAAADPVRDLRVEGGQALGRQGERSPATGNRELYRPV